MHPEKFLSRQRGGGLWWPASLLFSEAKYLHIIITITNEIHINPFLTLYYLFKRYIELLLLCCLSVCMHFKPTLIMLTLFNLNLIC